MLNERTWIAIYMPDDSIDPTRGGFKSEEEAWNYVTTHLCTSCTQALSDGYEIYSDGKQDHKAKITHPGGTSCGAEWLVALEDEYNKAENLEQVFEAGGWKKIDTTNFDKIVKEVK